MALDGGNFSKPIMFGGYIPSRRVPFSLATLSPLKATVRRSRNCRAKAAPWVMSEKI